MRWTRRAKLAAAAGCLAIATAVAAPRAYASPVPQTPFLPLTIEEIDYATYDVRVTDSKGIVTEATDFGHLTGPNILNAHRGDGEADIPFRLIRSIALGEPVPERQLASCTVVLKTGKTVELEVDNIEEMRLMGGKADFGDYRIRFGKVRRLELLRLSNTGGS